MPTQTYNLTVHEGDNISAITYNWLGLDGIENFSYYTINGSAIGGIDFQSVSGKTYLSSSHRQATFSGFSISNDYIYEGSETFKYVVYGDSPTSNNLVYNYTIDDEADRPNLSISNVTVSEGNGSSTALVTVVASNPAAFRYDIQIATTSGSAIDGRDFAGVNKTITMEAGSTSATVAIGILGDTWKEPTESFSVSVSSSLSATATATVTITDDDPAPASSPVAELLGEAATHLVDELPETVLSTTNGMINGGVQQYLTEIGAIGGDIGNPYFKYYEQLANEETSFQMFRNAYEPASDAVGKAAVALEVISTVNVAFNDVATSGMFGRPTSQASANLAAAMLSGAIGEWVAGGVATYVVGVSAFAAAPAAVPILIGIAVGLTAGAVAGAALDHLAVWGVDTLYSTSSASPQSVTSTALSVQPDGSVGALRLGDPHPKTAWTYNEDTKELKWLDAGSANKFSELLKSTNYDTSGLVFNQDLGNPNSEQSFFGSIGNDQIYGSSKNDLIVGGAGDDFLVAAGHDYIDAGSGNDVVSGLSAARGGVVRAGAGNDQLSFFVEGPGDYRLYGEDGDDQLSGGPGNDLLDGGAGNDTFFGRTIFNEIYLMDGGADTIKGGSGVDTLDFSDGSGEVRPVGRHGNDATAIDLHVDLGSRLVDVTYIDFYHGTQTATGPGDIIHAVKTIDEVENVKGLWFSYNSIVGNGEDNVLSGGLSSDYLEGANGSDTLFGYNDSDNLYGGFGDDVLHGGDGNDTLIGHFDIFVFEHNVLDGGAGDDVLYAGAGDDVSGGVGHDVLYVINAYDFTLDLGASSIEYVVSDFGNDSFDAHTQTESVQIYAGGGNDVVTGSDHGDVIWAGSGNDTVLGGTGNDTIIGDVGADSLSGGSGDDTLYVDSADTFLDGGSGHNAAYITGVPGDPGMTLDLAASHFQFVADFAGNSDNLNGAAATATLEIYAGMGNDTVQGGSGADVLWGQAGNDHLVGNGGSDVLVGGTGADTLEGGAGIDTLYFNSGGGSDGARDVAVLTPGSGTDIVFDFTPGEDQIDLTAYHTTFAALTITANGPHAGVYLGSTFLASVANQAGHLTAGDFLF